jgi:hypothetical protein
MKLSLAALLAVAFAASATPAAACGYFSCNDGALESDSYPPGVPALPPGVQEQVTARQGKGLSLAGFYNDPAVALSRREERAADYGYYRHRRHGPYGMVGPYGRRREAHAQMWRHRVD